MSTGAGIAQAPRIRMVYGPEAVRGTTPANLNVQQLRCISRDIDLETKGVRSAEVYPDRNVRDWRGGSLSVAAQLQYELSIGQTTGGTAVDFPGMDDMLASLLGGTWSAIGNAGTSTPGTLKVGTQLNTFTFERQFLDVALYESFPGCIPNDMTIDFKPEAIIGGQCTILGMGGLNSDTSSSVQGTGTLNGPTTAPPLDVFRGQIKEGGSVIGLVTTAAISIKNGRTLSPVIGSRFSPDVFDGQCMVTATMSIMFKDTTLRDKFLNETVSSVQLVAAELGATGTTGRRMVFTLPTIKYSTNQKKPKAEGPVVQDMQVECLYDSVSGTTIQIDRYL